MFDVDYTKNAAPSTAGEKIFYYLFILFIFAGFTAEVAVNFEPAKFTALCFIAAWVPLTVLHELAHAVVARLFGWKVEEFVIGYGRVIKEFNYQGTKVEFRMMPAGGYILPKPTKKNYSRLKDALVYFAGPGIELVVFFLFWWLVGYGKLLEVGTDYTVIVMQGIAISAATGAIVNLIPHGAITSNGNVPNDGLGIVLALFGKEREFEDSEK